MRPFYRKDLFREEIVMTKPISHELKVDSDEVKFEILKMEKGQSISLESVFYEIGIIILAGTATVETEGFKAEGLGSRKDVFSGKPTAIYMPCASKFTIKAEGYGELEIALCKVKAVSRNHPYIIEPEQIEAKERGMLNWKRKVHEIFIPQMDAQEKTRLLIGETYGCPGPWAVYPYQEDCKKTIFHFKLDRATGKAVQVMRDVNNPRAYYIKDQTTVVLQGGYEPIPEVDGDKVYYLWFKVLESTE